MGSRWKEGLSSKPKERPSSECLSEMREKLGRLKVECGDEEGDTEEEGV